MDYKIIIGCILILYGIAKVSLSLWELRPSNESADNTFAGKFLLVILLLFGVYSLIHGTGLLMKETVFGKFVQHTSVVGIVYAVFGIVLIELYTIIAYTNLPISKDETKVNKYKVIGIGGGVTFLIALIFKLLWERFRGRQLPDIFDFDPLILCFWLVILVSSFLALLLDAQAIFKGNDLKSELSSLVAIILNVDVV